VIKYISILIILQLFISCSSHHFDNTEIICTDSGCYGTYIGPEFIKGRDVAHQFSNKVCNIVGGKLKNLYKAGKYSRVDFSNIRMTTKGMGSGNVIYRITIPFIIVNEKCQAFTSFDHVGGWNHAPALTARKAQLKTALMKNDLLNISGLLKTKEGLQEYWIQWRNKDIQSECINF
jgi:hypothetical protein